MLELQVAEGQAVILVGYLISTNLAFSFPLHKELVEKISQHLWTIVLVCNFFAIVMSFLSYFRGKKSVFSLQICEYFLLPLSGFCLIQQITIYKSGISSMDAEKIISILFFGGFVLLTLLKIYYINQMFFTSPSKTILRFENSVRFLRVFKVVLSCFLYYIFDQKVSSVCLVVANCFDFVLILSKFTYVHLELEQCLMLANLNNILSSAIFAYFNFELSGSTLLVSICFGILLVVVYFFFHMHFFRIMEFKYSICLREIQSNKIDFSNENSKKLITSLLSCFQYLYIFNQKGNVIVSNTLRQDKVSQNFLQQLRLSYIIVLIAFLEEIDIQEKRIKILTESEKMKTTKRIKNIKTHKTLIPTDIDNRLMQSFSKKYHITKTVSEILQSKILFFNLFSFCTNLLEEEHNYDLSFSYISEFSIYFSVSLDLRFMMKQIGLYEKRSFRKQESIFYRTRNQKNYQYLKDVRMNYQIESSEIQHYMIFEQKLENLKQKIIEACQKEVKFFQSLSNRVKNVFSYERNLIQRKNNKQQIFLMFQECFSNYHYINFEQFTYIFLLFSIAFCKEIYKAEEVIHNRFRAPVKCIKTGREELLHVDNKLLSEKSILVCCGIDLEQFACGDIIMANAQFREKFGARKNSHDVKANKINDLIPLEIQKQKHSELMKKVFDFYQINKTKGTHSDYDCYLKVHLDRSMDNVLQKFKVSTTVFFSFEMALSFICTFEERNNDKYILEAGYINSDNEIKMYASENSQDQIQVEQLDVQMRLLKISEFQMYDFALETIEMSSNSESLYTINHRNQFFGEDKEEKFKKVEKILDSEDSSNQYKFKNKFLIALCYLLLSYIICVVFTYFEQNSMMKVSKQMNEIESFISGPQSCQVVIVEFLYLIQSISSGRITNQVCFPTIPSMRDYAKYNVQSCINEKLPSYLKSYFGQEHKTTPLMDTSLLGAIMRKILGQDIEYAQTSFLTVITYLSTTASYYIDAEINNFDLLEKITFEYIVRQMINSFSNSIQSHFFDEILQKNENTINSFKQKRTLAFTLAILFIFSILLLCFTVIVFAFKDIYQHYKILGEIPSTVFEQICYGIKQIMREIEKTKDCRFKKCSFYSDNTILIQTKTLTESYEREFSLNQFEKSICQDETQLPVISNEKDKTKISLMKTIVTGKTRVFVVLFLIFCIVLGLTAEIKRLDTILLSQQEKVFQMLKQASKMRVSLAEIEVASWMLFMNDNQIIPIEKTRETFVTTLEIMKQLKFYILLYEFDDIDFLKQTLYLQLCDVMWQSLGGTLEICKKNMAIYGRIKISQQLIYAVNKYSNLLEQLESQQRSFFEESFCANFQENTFLTAPILTIMWQKLLSIVSKEQSIRVQRYNLTFYILSVASILVFSIMLWVHLHRGHKLKMQVLKIGIIEDLYEKQTFKPLINRIYYQQK